MKQRPTLKEIARIAKVSHVTVSLALRSHPRISKATRERVKEIARRLDYRPDPMLSALMVYRRGVHQAVEQGTLAWINVWPNPRDLNHSFPQYWEGTRTRCIELGYRLEEFRLQDYEGDFGRLNRALRARNIRGLLIPPQARNRGHIRLDWDSFSSVTFGFTLARPKLHVVANAQFRAMVTALRELRRRGHRRIGLALESYVDERCDHNYTGGYLSVQMRRPAAERIPVLLIPAHDTATERRFAAWHDRHHPEAIVTMNTAVETWMARRGFKAPRDYSLATLFVPPGDTMASGIDQRYAITAGIAVDLVVNMMQRNERGIPTVPLRTLVEGEWVEGKTVRNLVSRKTPEIEA